MNRSLIVYLSQTGSTAKIAGQIAGGLEAEGQQVDLCNLKDGPPPQPSGYDLLGIGFPVYAWRPPFNITDYLRRLPDLGGMPTFVFMTYGTYHGDAGTMVRRMLAERHAREVGYLKARGEDHFLEYLKQGYMFSPSHPTEKELAEAEAFGHVVAERVTGARYAVPRPDLPPAALYRLERFFLNRFFVKLMWSRTFHADSARCNGCGICIRQCPTQNIRQGHGKQPAWGNNCLMCLTCQERCPRDAVRWLALLPYTLLMRYNVKQASADPGLTHVRVAHEGGRTRRLT